MIKIKTVKIWGGLLATTILATTYLSAPAFAQEPAARKASLEEIVVSSRKRDEKLQEIPESVSVFSGVQLENAKVESMRNFIDLVPNMIIRETFRSNESFLTMRGIASAQGSLPPVAIVIDGVQVGSNDFLNQDLLDIERIEVLRGPQGVLYGQGAIAGAINIVTQAPSNEFEAFAKASFGKAETYRIAGSVSAPIVEDTLFVRVSGYYKHSDGLIKNRFGTRISFDEEYTLRGRLLYQGENLSAAVRVSYTDGDGSCCIQDQVPFDQDIFDLTGRTALIGIDDVNNPGANSNVIGLDDTQFFDTSLKLDYDFDGVTLTSITGYADVEQFVFGDLDFTATPNQIQDLDFNSQVFNQELRLSSSGDSRFRWIAGGFYQDKKEVFDARIRNDALPNKPISFAFVQTRNSELWAVFAQASYDVTDRLELTGAARYDRDRQNSNNTSLPTPFAKATFDQFQPKVQLSYNFTDDVMTYATWSKGFRTGGFSQTTKFENEVATSYEIGIKSTLMDGLMTINASAFHIDYANQQLSFVVLDPNNPANVLRGVLNIPATDIDGLELEIAARPIEGLDISAGVGTTETSIEKIDETSPFASPEAIGKTSPLAPSFTFNSSITYRYPVANAMDVVTHASYRRRGGFFFDLNNQIKTGTKDFIDARVSLESEQWSVSVWGKNLGNTRHATNVSITNSRLRVPNEPRSYGVEASYRF